MTNDPHQPQPGQPRPPAPPYGAQPPAPGGYPPPAGTYPPAYPAQPPYGGYAPPGHPQVPMPALPPGPIGGTPRQWEARVRRLVRQGHTRDEILFTMREAGWPFEQAQEMIRRLTSKERATAIWMMVGTGIFGVLGIILLLAIMNSRSSDAIGGAFALIVFGVSGFIYGLVRLAKIRT